VYESQSLFHKVICNKVQCPSYKLRPLNIIIASLIQVVAHWNFYCVWGLLLGWCWRIFFVIGLKLFFMLTFLQNKKRHSVGDRKKLFIVAAHSNFYCVFGLSFGWCWQIFMVMRPKLQFGKVFCQKKLMTIFWVKKWQKML
jgi:hypothetical protein